MTVLRNGTVNMTLRTGYLSIPFNDKFIIAMLCLNEQKYRDAENV